MQEALGSRSGAVAQLAYMTASMASRFPGQTLHQSLEVEEATQRVIRLAAQCAARGWTPATAGNFSVRIDEARIAITRSGADKGALTPADILILPLGRAAAARSFRRSADPLDASTAAQPNVGAVAHAHPPSTTVLSMMPDARGGLSLEGIELLKALPGQMTHETGSRVPVLPNTQDMTGLAARLDWNPSACRHLSWRATAYIVGGTDETAAFNHMEALEYMFDLEFRRRQITR